jgi:hypothetical protein
LLYTLLGVVKIMEYINDYIVVTGERNVFEKEMNKLSKQGYMWCGNMNTNFVQDVLIYTQLVSKVVTK